MKILLVSGAAPFSTRDVWEGYLNGLSAHGITVQPYPVFSALSYVSANTICNDIIGKALDIRNDFDATIFVDGLFFRNGREWVPLTLTSHGMATVLIPTDDPYEAIPDYVYTLRFTNERTLAQFESPYLPTATELGEQPGSAVEQDLDLIFVGTIFEDRWPIIRDVARFCEVNEIRFEVHGPFVVNHSEIANLNYVKVFPGTVASDVRRSLYRRSKVVLNLFRESDTAESVNPRVYEVAAMATSALLSENRGELKDLFGSSVYAFETFRDLSAQLGRILGNPDERLIRIAAAKDIARSTHTYRHRARQVIDSLENIAATVVLPDEPFPLQQNVAWIFGAGRTGSTWLLELLQLLPGIRVWNEPRFGWGFVSLDQHPEELEREDAFFRRKSQEVWSAQFREMFLVMAASRWPSAPNSDVLVVKEVNAPELAPFVSAVFPTSKYILLLRDPFDILDSQIDMQHPDSWNANFWQPDQLHWSDRKRVEFLANHIERSIRLSLLGFEKCSDRNRLKMSYEGLLEDTAEVLSDCAKFLGLQISASESQASAESNAFAEFKGRKGRSFFRRFGKSGIWRSSLNFTPEVRRVAERVLGPVRRQLGYKNGG